MRLRPRKKAQNCDRFSDLPNDLIVKVLSGLDMKDAVRTGVLSKRWGGLWKEVNNTVFHCSITENPYRGKVKSKKELQEFVSFVDKTLIQCSCESINKFSFSVNITGLDVVEERSRVCGVEKILAKWLDFVTERNVKIIELGIALDFATLRRFFVNSRCEKLEIDKMFGFDVMIPTNWPLLNCLSLKRVYVEDKFMESLFMGCPMLEMLILEDVRGLYNLNITSEALRSLKVCSSEMDVWGDAADEDNEGWGILKIRAHWLQELEVVGNFEECLFKLVDVTSLKKASFNFTCLYSYSEAPLDDMGLELVNEMLRPARHVDELQIGTMIVQSLSLSRVLDEIPMVFECKHLTLYSPRVFPIYEIPGIVCTLRNMPHLETLVLEVCPSNEHDLEANYLKKDPWAEEIHSDYEEHFSFNGEHTLNMQPGNFLHLKEFRIEYDGTLSPQDQENHTYEECFDFELVAYVLAHARVLEKFVILHSKSDWAKERASLLSTVPVFGNQSGEWKLKRTDSMYGFRLFSHIP